MKFRVGDKVKIKEDLTAWNYNGCYVPEEMASYRGKIATITMVDEIGEPHSLDIDDGFWAWSSPLIDKCDFTLSDIKDGMVVLTRDEGYFIYINNCFMDNDGYLRKGGFTSDLMSDDCLRGFDIMAVYESKAHSLKTILNKDKLALVWERKPEVKKPEIKEMTIEEIKKALNITCEFKIKE